jgi:hypothetical protein
MIPLAPMALGGEPLSDASIEAFWEGTCVVAAHQHLLTSGESGYVDGSGQLVAGFADDEARIRWFYKTGADLINTRSAQRTQT